ncbi:MAG: hypothetical protein UY05_C0058G0011, partial [Candidatus Peregrinibacteria bacterium GW2011_GWA2_47_7]
TQKSLQQNKCTLGIYAGYQLAADGSAILVACPSKNALYTLYVIDKMGKETAVATKQSSDDNKMIFIVDKKFDEGRYLFQVRKSPATAALSPFAATAYAADKIEQSDPVLVKILQDTKVPLPTVKDIQGVDVSTVKNVSVAADKDGKIHVRGVADTFTMVIGTFSSAVFTSAMLADVASGSFDIASAVPLEPGQHEVVIYATRPEEGVQSAPVRIEFTLIATAQAAAIESKPSASPYVALTSGNTPFIAGGVVLVLTVAVISVVRGRKKRRMSKVAE